MLTIKNKKALVLKALIRIIIAVIVLLLVVIPACNMISKLFFSSGSSIKAFEEFVNGINEMPPDSKEAFLLELGEGITMGTGSAIVGFSKTGNYKCDECVKCGPGVAMWRGDMKITRPSNPECAGTACIFLCDGNFMMLSACGAGTGIGECEEYICMPLNSNIDIVDETTIKDRTVLPDVLWHNGFLFLNYIPFVNGLEINKEKQRTLYVEKNKGNMIGVCNQEMLDYNRDKFGEDKDICINKGLI